MNDKAGTNLVVRTKGFALRVIRLYSALPKTTLGQVIGKQMLRSGTSVGAQYREARRATKSGGVHQAKHKLAIQEIEETALLDRAVVRRINYSCQQPLTDLQRETSELDKPCSCGSVKSRQGKA